MNPYDLLEETSGYVRLSSPILDLGVNLGTSRDVAQQILQLPQTWGAGYVEVHSRDAVLRISMQETRDQLTYTEIKTIGPSQLCGFAVSGGGTDLGARYMGGPNSAVAITFDETTGLPSAGAPLPQITARFFPGRLNRPVSADVTMVLFSTVVSSDGLGKIASAATVNLGVPPGYCRRVRGYSDRAIVWRFRSVSGVGGAGNPEILHTFPASETLDAIIPSGVQLQAINNSGADANVSLAYTES